MYIMCKSCKHFRESVDRHAEIIEWRRVAQARKVEIERLREALEDVSNALGGSDMRDIARQALAGDGE